MQTNEIEGLVQNIRGALPKAKHGSLKIWGEWFGKPYDNNHILRRCDAEENVLWLYFDEDEKLSIWSPKGLIINDVTFRIADAERVRWEWFYYGRPKNESNLYFEDFVKTNHGIVVTTNVDWYDRKFKPRQSEPAVEIL